MAKLSDLNDSLNGLSESVDAAAVRIAKAIKNASDNVDVTPQNDQVNSLRAKVDAILPDQTPSEA